jgi:hypothetical protein
MGSMTMTIRPISIVSVLITVGFCLALPHPGYATPQVSWNGPACQDGAEKFAACSQEPAVPDDPSPCFESHFDNAPDPIQIYLIAICQASKAALGASPDAREDALTRVVGLGTELSAEISNDPSDVQNDSDALNSVGHDLEALGSSMITYSSTEDESDWEDVSGNLDNLTVDAQVLGE